jgi:GTP-dependent phosphoenolpyruvate carboxykinase
MSEEAFATLMRVDETAWRAELEDHAVLFDQLKGHLPAELAAQHRTLDAAFNF